MIERRFRPFLACLVFVTLATLGAHTALAASLGPISEETPPAVCDPGSFLSGVRCTGDYCDNLRISCSRLPGASLGRALWTPWVSEEQGRRACPSRHLIAGLTCRGRYCDNLSLYCVEVTDLRLVHCSQSRSVSEEGGGRLDFLAAIGADKAGQRVAARGITCSGRYCDNKTFNVCEVSIAP
jgi:hypothetical protein